MKSIVLFTVGAVVLGEAAALTPVAILREKAGNRAVVNPALALVSRIAHICHPAVFLGNPNRSRSLPLLNISPYGKMALLPICHGTVSSDGIDAFGGMACTSSLWSRRRVVWGKPPSASAWP